MASSPDRPSPSSPSNEKGLLRPKTNNSVLANTVLAGIFCGAVGAGVQHAVDTLEVVQDRKPER